MELEKGKGTTKDEDLAALRINRGRRKRRLPLWPLVIGVPAVALFFSWPALMVKIKGVEVSAEPVIQVLSLKSLESSSPEEAELSAAGYLVADRQAVLASKVTGRLAKLTVREAQHVKKDAIVAEVEHHEIDAAIRQMNAELDIMKAELQQLASSVERAERQVEAVRAPLETFDAELKEIEVMRADAQRRLQVESRLMESAGGSANTVDDRKTEVHALVAKVLTTQRRKIVVEKQVGVQEAQLVEIRSSVKVAEARVKGVEARIGVLEAQLVEYFIRSPFDGVVTEKAAELGEIIAPISVGGTMARGSIVTIADWASLQGEVDVAETYIGRVRPGQRVAITIDAFPGKTFPGKVHRILPRADRSKATIPVRIEFVERALEILPDMGVRVKFLPDDAPARAEWGEAKPVLCLPQRALQTSGTGEPFVYVVLNDQASRRVVKTGEKAGKWVEVLDGLVEGEKVVTAGAEQIKQDPQKVVLAE